MKVLVFTKYPRMGASSRLRTLQYLPLLEQYGLEFTVHSLFDEKYLNSLYNENSRSGLVVFQHYLKRLLKLMSIGQYDLIWIEKELFPYLPATIEKILSIFNVKYIVDYDDAIFHHYDLSENKFIRLFLSNKIDKVMKSSECVIAGNNYLSERAKNAGAKKIQFIPTVVDYDRYQRADNKYNNRGGDEPLTIGWIGSPTTQIYVIEILSQLLKVHRKIPFRLVLVGATKEVTNSLIGLDVVVQPWQEDTEIDLLRDMDIGIMPLKDGQWERGKCGYKLIQYMACGVPVIASSVGVNKDIIGNAGCGLLVDDDLNWEDALLQLLESSQLRIQYGHAGKGAVKNYYSLESQLPVLAHILNDLTR